MRRPEDQSRGSFRIRRSTAGSTAQVRKTIRRDPKTWIKANPRLKENGGFLDIEKIRQQYVSHVAEGDLTSFKTVLPQHVGPEGEPRDRHGEVGRVHSRLAGSRTYAQTA